MGAGVVVVVVVVVVEVVVVVVGTVSCSCGCCRRGSRRCGGCRRCRGGQEWLLLSLLSLKIVVVVLWDSDFVITVVSKQIHFYCR